MSFSFNDECMKDEWDLIYHSMYIRELKKPKKEIEKLVLVPKFPKYVNQKVKKQQKARYGMNYAFILAIMKYGYSNRLIY